MHCGQHPYQDKLLALIDAIARENAGKLTLKPRGMWQDRHDEFCRILGSELTEALRDTGFAWAKIPSLGNQLYKILVASISSAGATYRIALMSEDSVARETARHVIADSILRQLAGTKTAVVRRKRRKSDQR